MRYSKEERDIIGKRIFDGEITINDAAVEYGINTYTARDYYRTYKSGRAVGHPDALRGPDANRHKRVVVSEELMQLSKEELIEEIIKSKMEVERLKKGYSMEGGWYRRSLREIRQLEYEVIETLSQNYSVFTLCKLAGIPRGSYYKWKSKS